MKKTQAEIDELVEKAIVLAENGEQAGFCLACGAEHDEIEPDARKYECEQCGEYKVYGAEEIVLMYAL